MITASKYNIFIPIKSDCIGASHILFNTLAGSIDLIDAIIYQVLHNLIPIKANKQIQSNYKTIYHFLSDEVIKYLDRRGYIFIDDDEDDHLDLLYTTLLDFHRQNSTQQVIIIPSYNCNLCCEYCWQRKYDMNSPVITEEMINSFFNSLPEIIDNFEDKKIELVIFGGEPLNNYENLRIRVKSILQKSRQFNFSTKIITNGTELCTSIREIYPYVDLIQVTLDGPPSIHNSRRPLPGGDSFQQTHIGINQALKYGIRINLRVNIDKENLSSLPELANIIEQSGWTETGLFKPHLAPVKNHNVNESSSNQGTILKELLDLIELNTSLKMFNLEGFAGIKYFQGFKETGLFPLHRFFRCEAQINFLAFDLHGDIYACWDAAGIPELSIGKYYPTTTIDKNSLSLWRDRNGLHLDKCKRCKISPICGGGCMFQSFEKYNNLSSSYCDSLYSDYCQVLKINSDWLIEHAIKGDHAVGFILARKIVSEVNLEFGLLDSKREYLNQL